MKEKVDALYQEYLKEKLDLVFSGADGKSQDNIFYSPDYNIIGGFCCGYAVIKKNNKYNYIDKSGKLLSLNWFDKALEFDNGYGLINVNGRCYHIDTSGRLVSEEDFDNVWYFVGSVAKVKKNGKYNYINTQGKKLFEEWFAAADEFSHNGNAKVEKDGKYNFINTEGKIIFEEWFDYVGSFDSNGYALVKRNSKYNYIDSNCKLAASEWFEDVNFKDKYNQHQNNSEYSFADIYHSYKGYAIIKREGKYNFLNLKGELISKEWFDEVWEFSGGYAPVRKGNKENYIDASGRLLSKEWFDCVYIFKNGYAKVQNKGKYNRITTEGKLVSIEWFDEIGEFENGYAKVKLNNQYNYIDKNGKLSSEKWFDRIWNYGYGFYFVRAQDMANFIDRNGKLLSEEWFDVVWEFTDNYNYTKVKKNNQYNCIDKSGKLLFEEWFDEIELVEKGYAKAKKGNMVSLIDPDGNLLVTCVYDFDAFESLQNFIVLKSNKARKDYYHVRKIDLGGCRVKKELFSYQCEFLSDKFKLKYQPIKRYGTRYYLCLDKEGNVYLYDRFGNSYSLLGTVYDIKYDDNFIIDDKNKQIYFICESKLLNVTEYCKNNLMSKRIINVSKTAGDILTREEFSFLNMSKIDEIMVEEHKKNLEIKLAQEKAKKIKDLEDKKQEVLKKEEERREKELAALKQIQEGLKILQSISSPNSKIKRIRIDDIFDDVGTHKEIKPILVAMLGFIDLMLIKFDNVKVEGIDFRGSNISIGYSLNPQKVYGKSLQNCNFEGIYLSYSVNFSGVDIRGCKFGKDDDYMTLDRIPESFKNAIYDETTTYNGQPLTEIFAEEKKK